MSNREFVIPTELEEWSDWEERHGRLRREGSGERVGRRTSSISYFSMTKTTEKIIVALDVASKKEALLLVEQLRTQISFFKIGLQLSASLDVQMLTIHLSGGSEMIRAAVASRTNNMSILGVTVLTSTDEKALREVGVRSTTEEYVLQLAKLGVEAEIDGLIASAHEIKSLRAEFGGKIKIVVPGIRPSWAETGDQKRVMTPREALEAGANYLVIGRPITTHKNPREAVEKILEEINS